MKATLTYDLPEEQEEFKLACDGVKWSLVAWDLDQWLRSEIKYQEQNKLQPARDKLYEFVDKYELQF